MPQEKLELPNDAVVTHLLKDCEAYQAGLLQVKSQAFRIEAANNRLRGVQHALVDRREMQQARARTEAQILEKNMNMLKSRTRTAALKNLCEHFKALEVDPPYQLQEIKHFYQTFSFLYLGETEPGDDDHPQIEALLKNIWHHFRILIEEAEYEAVDLSAENNTISTFRQYKFHPLEKMILTRFHQILLQVRIKHQQMVQSNFAEEPAADPLLFNTPTDFILQAPQFEADEIEKQLHLIQRQLFQIQSKLRTPLQELDRQKKLEQRERIKAKQALVYSQLRQLFIWESLSAIQDFAKRFSALHSQLQEAQNINQVFSVSERGEYTQKRLNQELYQLYLDCRQTKAENHELSSLAFIQNQQHKIQEIDQTAYQKVFLNCCQQDQVLLEAINDQPDIITSGECNNLEGLLSPLHSVLKQLNLIKQKA